ncbi:MAG: type VI secretion system baseplate subunit TssG [Burkholderiales bacterium]|jgi:type VI secretion system protein ImpH|nr:type VI secretion system baseplate subunit TssG [Burkholderiales bacterium]
MQRRIEFSVIERFFREPYRFQFFQAVRLLERWRAASTQKEDIKAFEQQHLRFINSTSLSFPASEIAAAKAYAENFHVLSPEELSEAIRNAEIETVEITPTFFGLLGVQGALPFHYSERLATFEAQKRDPGARSFFDIFSNRAAYLFYHAWKKYRLALMHESGTGEQYLSALLSIAGLGHSGLRNRLRGGKGEVCDSALARYATAVKQRPPAAKFLQRALAEYFGITFSIEQFVGSWYVVPENCRTELGGESAYLGRSAFIGERVWQRNLRLRVKLGPLNAKKFEDFLPGGHGAEALKKLLLLMGGITYEYEVRLILAKEDINGCVLDNHTGARLGWDSFLCSKASTVDRDDAQYVIRYDA